MPFPISIVGVAVVGIVSGVVAGASHNDYEDYSDYSKYSDAAAKKKREAERREEKRKKDLATAKQMMNATLSDVKLAMADAAGNEGSSLFKNWNVTADYFEYKNFSEEYNKLDNIARDKVAQATIKTFDNEEKLAQQELDEINAILRKISEKKLNGD